jgi:hypothetical protein
MTNPESRDAPWCRLITKNPHWSTDGADLTAAGLRKLFDVVFEAGHRLGVENGKAMSEETERSAAVEELLRKFGMGG